MSLPHPRVKLSIVGSLLDREVACSASDRHGSNFESCVWRTVSPHSPHHPQEVLLAQFSLYVHNGGLKPDSFHLHAFVKRCRYNLYNVIGYHGYRTTTVIPNFSNIIYSIMWLNTNNRSWFIRFKLCWWYFLNAVCLPYLNIHIRPYMSQ